MMSYKKSTVYPFYFRDSAGDTTSDMGMAEGLDNIGVYKVPAIFILTSMKFQKSPQAVQICHHAKTLSAP
jgi:hypothetical protein